ncbi:MAG: DUF177 domain-containing protein [Alphaproteobacteria bacterium]|nr:DUF177 domain-containing protein [Alphaproteobacteria bacterium]
MTDDAPFHEYYDLGDLGRNGAELTIAADADDRARIARWAGLTSVESFDAKVRLKKHSNSRFALEGEFTADVTQECVVTLEPVRSRIEREVHRELHLTQATRHRPQESLELAAGAGDDEVPEEIESLEYDLAAPLLEELSLALDPYPRAPGVEFDAPAEPEAKPESPFAVLKSLKKPG